MVLLLVSITVLHLVTLAMLLIATLEKVRDAASGDVLPLLSCFRQLCPLSLSLGSAVLVGLVRL